MLYFGFAGKPRQLNSLASRLKSFTPMESFYLLSTKIGFFSFINCVLLTQFYKIATFIKK